MGDARVQYYLERTLPGLQLAAQHGLFDKDTELRAITQRRRTYENALVRRRALAADYKTYIQYEEDLEKLQLLRLARARELDDIPRNDVAKMHSEATHHIVSIFERGVQRCKYDIELWQQYMAWAQGRKMRTAVSRIAARALALFPNNTQLWLSIADHELNSSMSTTTARAMLQRALRLNAIAHPDQVRAQRQEEEHARPFKRARRKPGSSMKDVPPREVQIRPSDTAAENVPTLVISEKDHELVRLWIEYLRMESVFLERLRRRRAVLSILEEGGASQDQSSGAGIKGSAELDIDDAEWDAVPEATQGEDAPPPIAELRNGSEKAPAESSDSILRGAIPASIIVSAVSLDSASCLPPRTHFSFLLAAAQLFLGFPYLGDAGALRARLRKTIESALASRFPSESVTHAYNTVSAILDGIYARSTKSNIEDNIEQEEEQGSMLRSASKLSRRECAELALVFGEQDDRDLSGSASDAIQATLRIVTAALKLEASDPVRLATDMRDILASLRMAQQGESASSKDYAAQLHYVALFQDLARQHLGDDFVVFLAAWKQRLLSEAKAAGFVDSQLVAVQIATMLSNTDVEKTESAPRIQELLHEGLDLLKAGSVDETLLSALGDAIRALTRRNDFDFGAAKKAWTRLLGTKSGRQHAKIWQSFASWLFEDEAGRIDAALQRKELQQAIAQTTGAAEAHDTLLRAYYAHFSMAKPGRDASTQKGALSPTAQWIATHALVQPTFWRWAAQFERAAANDAEDVTERSAHLLQSKVLYARLLAQQESASAKSFDADTYASDACEYLAVLLEPVERTESVNGTETDSSAALSVLRQSLTRLDGFPRARARLEQGWQALTAKLDGDGALRPASADGKPALSDGQESEASDEDSEADENGSDM